MSNNKLFKIISSLILLLFFDYIMFWKMKNTTGCTHFEYCILFIKPKECQGKNVILPLRMKDINGSNIDKVININIIVLSI